MTPSTRIVLRARNSSHGQCRCNRCSVSMPGPARRTSEEVVLALTDAGFFRIFTPMRFGGYVAEIRTAIATRLCRPRPLQGDGWIRSPAGAGGDPHPAQRARRGWFRREKPDAAVPA